MDNIENISDGEEGNLTYEQLREKRLKQNLDLLETLGVNQAAETLSNNLHNKSLAKNSTSVKKIKPYTKHVSEPTRRSLRIANLPAPKDLTEANNPNNSNVNYDSHSQEDSINNSFESDITNQDSISLPEDDNQFFDKLNEDLVIKEAVNDFHTCGLDRFTRVVKSLKMNGPALKISYSRIYSLAIHPSETSLVVAAGDMKGNIALYNNNNSDTRQCQVHSYPVNCISFCTWEPHKLFSTSHDGSVRCGDIMKRTFDIIYSSKLWAKDNVKDTHATWHTEYERNLLIGNGSGRVDLIDTRKPNVIQNTAWCHERSVRTVHCHPLQKHYFLTSSGVGEVSLWDLRNMTDKTINPVLKFEHSRSLTSAFFSGSGINMVSTSNDNYIRIFDTSKLHLKATKPIKEIAHDNHTGRWLSVFKAKWNPGRDDSFFIGSMLVPKRIQIYCYDGKLLHNLTSESMTTYCPVIEVHPTQGIYVGGNASGRLHIFSTEEQL